MKALKFSLYVLLTVTPFFNQAQQYYFKNYSAENGLPFVQVFCMYQDKLGYLWSGGYGGLSRFDGKTFKNYTKKDGLLDNYVNAICEDDSSALYVASNKGINVLKNGKVQPHLIYNLNGLAITSICKGYHHSVYVGTTKGLYIISNRKVRPVSKIQNVKVNCVYKLDSSIICVGTENGVYLYGHQTFKHLTEQNGLPSNSVNCITKLNNDLVIGTHKGL
jgi:ligand-binding sensor domain-containing protein